MKRELRENAMHNQPATGVAFVTKCMHFHVNQRQTGVWGRRWQLMLSIRAPGDACPGAKSRIGTYTYSACK
jgi:hypothetical protein